MPPLIAAEVAEGALARGAATKAAQTGASAGARTESSAAASSEENALRRAQAQAQRNVAQNDSFPAQKEKKPQRINIITAVCMVGLAILLDAIQALLELIPGLGIILGWAIAGFAFIIFWVWFFFCHVNYLDRNGAVKIMISIGTILFESLPLVDILPALSLGVLCLVLVTRMEDSEHNLLGTLAGAKSASMSPQERMRAGQRAQELTARDNTTAQARMTGTAARGGGVGAVAAQGFAPGGGVSTAIRRGASGPVVDAAPDAVLSKEQKAFTLGRGGQAQGIVDSLTALPKAVGGKNLRIVRDLNRVAADIDAFQSGDIGWGEMVGGAMPDGRTVLEKRRDRQNAQAARENEQANRRERENA